MVRARLDDVKKAIADLPVSEQKNVMAVAKTHGVSTRFLEVVKEGRKKDFDTISDLIQSYIDEIKNE